MATDGGAHAFLIDVMVHPLWRRRGIGVDLVRLAVTGARSGGCEWLHVDFEPQLAAFYLDGRGFVPTAAGLVRLQ